MYIFIYLLSTFGPELGLWEIPSECGIEPSGSTSHRVSTLTLVSNISGFKKDSQEQSRDEHGRFQDVGWCERGIVSGKRLRVRRQHNIVMQKEKPSVHSVPGDLVHEGVASY